MIEPGSQNLYIREKVHLLYAALPYSLTVTSLLAIILAATQWGAVSSRLLLMWLGLFFAVSGARLLMWRAYQRQQEKSGTCNYPLCLQRFRVGVLVAGLIWGVAALILFPLDDIERQAFFSFVLVGISAGSITSLAIDRYSVMLFVPSVLSPLMLTLMLVYGEGTQLSMALMIGLFIIYMVSTSRRIEETMSNNLLLQHAREEKAALEVEMSRERELFAGGPVAVFVWTPREGWPVEYVSPNIAGIMGYSADEMMSEDFNYAGIVHPDDINRVGEEVAEYLISGVEQFEQSYRIKVKSGEYRWFYDFTMPERDAEGNLQRIRGYMFDQTEMRRAEEENRRTTMLLSSVLEAASEVAIIATDSCGRITVFNHGAEQILGYSSDAIQGKSVLPLYQPEQVTARERTLSQRLGRTVSGFRVFVEIPDRDGAEECEWTLLRKDESTLLASVVVTAMHTPTGETSGYLMMATDITMRKQIERMKDEFVSTVSHELRTPLTSIRGSLGLLVGGAVGELPPQAQQLLELADANSQHLSILINDILDMEKIAAGKMDFDLQSHRLLPLVKQALKSNEGYASQHKVKLVLQQSMVDGRAEVDAQRLQQVLSNYISNAVKFSHEDGEVLIAMQQRGEVLRISVIDQGPGVPEKFQTLIFEKFSQADASDTRQQGGSGLGLAISKELMHGMGGEVGFNSEEGKGAVFWLELPLLPD